jgi:hypothetical protein
MSSTSCSASFGAFAASLLSTLSSMRHSVCMFVVVGFRGCGGRFLCEQVGCLFTCHKKGGWWSKSKLQPFTMSGQIS